MVMAEHTIAVSAAQDPYIAGGNPCVPSPGPGVFLVEIPDMVGAEANHLPRALTNSSHVICSVMVLFSCNDKTPEINSSQEESDLLAHSSEVSVPGPLVLLLWGLW